MNNTDNFARVTFGPASVAPAAPVGPVRSQPPISGNAGLQVSPERPIASAPAAAPVQFGSNVQVRKGNEAHFLDNNGRVTTTGTTKINMAEVSNGEAGILSTATRNGAPKTAAELKPTDTIRVHGRETSVAVAERLGLLKRDPVTGIYSENVAAVEAAAAPPKEPEDPRESDPHFGQPLPGEGATEALGELVRSTTAGTQTRALLDVMDHGEINARTLAAAASEASVEPHEIAAKADTVIEAFKAQAAEVAESLGADFEGFSDWARSHRLSEVKEAMRVHGMQRSTAGYVPLVREYVATLDQRDPDAILNGNFAPGVTAYYNDVKREVVLRIPGRGEVSWGVAVRTGIVKPYRSRTGG